MNPSYPPELSRRKANTLLFVSLLLFVSWVLPPTRSLWSQLDLLALHSLNGSLEGHPFWQGFWAIANHKIIDMAGVTLMMTLTLHWVYSPPPPYYRGHQALYLAIATLLGAVICKTLVAGSIHLLHLCRASPSLVRPDVFSLNEAVSWIYVKPRSSDCFPGDHSCTVFLWAALLSHFSSWRYGLTAIIFAVCSTLPRLFAGTHWLSDSLVGSLGIVLILLVFFLRSPLYSLFSSQAPTDTSRYSV